MQQFWIPWLSLPSILFRFLHIFLSSRYFPLLLLLLLLPSVNLWFFVFGGCVSLIKAVPFALFPHGSCSFLYNSNPCTIERAWDGKILLAAFQSSFEGRNYPSWESGQMILRYCVYFVFLVLLFMKSFRSSRHLS